jgi:hypothetical protein
MPRLEFVVTKAMTEEVVGDSMPTPRFPLPHAFPMAASLKTTYFRCFARKAVGFSNFCLPRCWIISFSMANPSVERLLDYPMG